MRVLQLRDRFTGRVPKKSRIPETCLASSNSSGSRRSPPLNANTTQTTPLFNCSIVPSAPLHGGKRQQQLLVVGTVCRRRARSDRIEQKMMDHRRSRSARAAPRSRRWRRTTRSRPTPVVRRRRPRTGNRGRSSTSRCPVYTTVLHRKHRLNCLGE